VPGDAGTITIEQRAHGDTPRQTFTFTLGSGWAFVFGRKPGRGQRSFGHYHWHEVGRGGL
jgi:hypothetical protein